MDFPRLAIVDFMLSEPLPRPANPHNGKGLPCCSPHALSGSAETSLRSTRHSSRHTNYLDSSAANHHCLPTAHGIDSDCLFTDIAIQLQFRAC